MTLLGAAAQEMSYGAQSECLGLEVTLLFTAYMALSKSLGVSGLSLPIHTYGVTTQLPEFL